MHALRVPKRWDDVTPAWMNAAIASRHPNARVKDVTLLTNDDGAAHRGDARWKIGAHMKRR